MVIELLYCRQYAGDNSVEFKVFVILEEKKLKLNNKTKVLLRNILNKRIKNF
jgi:hypothetical protein